MPLWPTPDGLVLEVRTIKLATVGAGGLAWTQPGWLHSIVVAGPDVNTVANVSFYDGRDTTGEPIAVVRVMAGTTVPIIFGMPGTPLASGLFVATDQPGIAGSVVVSREVKG